jgi:thiol-disulfide isomerase/thioredoxin
MKPFLKKILTYFIVFVTAGVAIGISIVIGIGITGLPENLNHIVVFITISLITYFGISKTKKLVSPKGIVYAILLAWFVLFLPKAVNSSFNFILVNIPFFISFILAITGGYFYSIKQTPKTLLFAGAIPIVLSLGIGGFWYHQIVYGSVSGEITEQKAPAFSFTDQDGNEINNSSSQNKIVLMDFWFIGCPPCWVKFPELQRIYDLYQNNNNVDIYAVNRPMKKDKPNQLFSSVEKKGYTFPVVLATEASINDFNIEYFPHSHNYQ